MPKDRRMTASSVDRCAMACPYSCSSKISDLTNPETYSPHAGCEKDWEEARCPICMEHPHNAVLLLCSSREKGCRPFICDTSCRHSNCLDQFQKSTSSQSQLVCPLCRGSITGWDVINPARVLMNSKTRNCSLETCNFEGNYAELRKHARRAHPFERPSEATPSRQSDWAMLEQQMEMEDVLAHQSDAEHDWGTHLSWDELGDYGSWSDGSFFDFPSGMSDIEDNLVDEMFSGLSMSFMSMHSSFPEEELIDSGSSRSTRSTVMGLLASLSNDQVEHALGDLRSMSRSSHRDNENDETNVRSRSSRRGRNEETNGRSRSSHRRDNDSASRPRVSDQGSRHHGGNVRDSSGTRSRQTSSRARSRSRYDLIEVRPPPRPRRIWW